MNDKFDELAKAMAQPVARCAALKRFGIGLAAFEGGNIEFAVADVAAVPPAALAAPKTLAAQKEKATSKTKASRSTLDAYVSNYQWYLQAIGAAKPCPGMAPASRPSTRRLPTQRWT